MSFSIFLFLGSVLLLAGYSSCSSRSISVTSFYSQYPTTGKFTVDIPAHKKSDLEYRYYTNLVASDLVAYGFNEVFSSDSADYKMRINYNIKPTSESYVSSSTSSGYDSNWPWSNRYDTSVEIKSVTEYRATMELILTNTSSKETVFKTSASTETSNSLFASVGDCLAQGIFNHFPSLPGKVIVYELSCDDRN